MKVGFSGTRQGMTGAQRHAFYEWICSNPVDLFAHGDCIGADDDAANILYEIRHGEDPSKAHEQSIEKEHKPNDP